MTQRALEPISEETGTIENATRVGNEDTYCTRAQIGEAEHNIDSPSVKGRLFLCYEFWEKTLKASNFVLNIVSNGYFLPINIQPPPFFAKNNASGLRNKHFVESEIQTYLKKSYIREIDSTSYCCNPLTVAEGKKLRLVLDLRHVNQFLNIKSFRYEDLRVVSDLLQENGYFTTFDLVSGYHHIDINSDHFKYLGFQWEFPDGRLRNFQFVVLVFGLATACYLFTKVTKPLLKRWRLLGFRAAIYLDDGFNTGPTFQDCEATTRTIVKDLESAGFVINIKKSSLVPRQVGEWLGTTINSTDMSFSVPERKIADLRRLLCAVVDNKIATKYLSS